MGNGEKKQKSVLKETNDSIIKSIELLNKLRLFKERSDLVIRGTIIEPSFDEGRFMYAKTISEFYSYNSSKFIIKLVDNSFFTLYILTNKEGNIEKFSYGFCSCPFADELLIESDYDLNDTNLANKILSNVDNLKKGDIKNALLIEYFMNACSNDERLVNSIVDLMNNPLYIRCDYDGKNNSPAHPEYHLTVNFIKDSRFQIDKPVTFYNFVTFIIDIIYGKKITNKQFLRI